MDEHPQHTNKPEDVAALLSATKPVASEDLRLQLEERLVSRRQAGHAQAAYNAREQMSGARATHADSLPRRAAAPLHVPTFRAGFGSRMGRVASFGMGVVGVALLALLFVGMSAFLQSRQTRGVGPDGRLGPGQPSVTSTPAGIDIGGAYMLDPQGDVALARRVIEKVVESGTPQVILSRRVVGGELPCLGFGGMTDIEMHPTGSFGLVVLKGNLRPFPRLPLTVADVYAEGYTQYLYDEQSAAITAWGPLNWGTLRATFGGFRWPPESPMYLSPDGQPSFAELDLWELNPDSKVTDVNVAQTLNGWTVTVSRVYALGESILIAYTIVGPNPRDRFMVERPVLELEGLRVDGTTNQLRGEVMGPSVDLTGFGGLPASAQPREVNMRFVVPAIHVRPSRYPCELPGLKPEDYPTPTRIPNDPPVGDTGATPVPDLETVGPFTLDLRVVVEPKPTQPVLPPPPPTLDAPDIPPVPTAPADATQAAIASMTVVPVPTQIPGLQATLAARATTSPYPTAEPPTVQVGRPSISTARRGDLSMEVRLDDNSFLWGENGRALITLRNEGEEPLYIFSRRLMLVDEAGPQQLPWPVIPGMPDGWPGWDGGPSGLGELAPGGVMSDTFTFQVPPPGEAIGKSHNLTAWVVFTRSDIGGRGSDGETIDLRVGPLPIKVSEPEPRQHLRADLRMDDLGWTMRVTDGEGRAPAGPFWGGWEAQYNMGGTSSALPEPSQTGGSDALVWAVPWHEGSADTIRGGSEVTIQVWVAARGYVPAVVTGTLPSAVPTGVPGAGNTPTPIRSIPPAPTAPTGSPGAPTPTLAPDFQALARGFWEAKPRDAPYKVEPGGIAFRSWYAFDFTPDGAATVTWDNGINCTTAPATISGDTLRVTADDIEAEFTIHGVDGAWVYFRQGGQQDVVKLQKIRDDPRVVCY